MKVGDLVKHPQGMSNVCRDTYGLGLIVGSTMYGPPDNRRAQHLVWWCNLIGPMYYIEDNLEIISESR